MASIIAIPQPWFPSLFTWEPVVNSMDKPKLGLRHRKGDDPREIYGAADSNQQKQNPITSLRWSFLGLAFEVPFGLVRIPFRIIHLLAGDFIPPATAKARNEWLLKIQAWSLQPNRNQPPPSDLQRALILAKWILIELARNVGKIALCVLAIIPLEITALCGIFLNPYDAAFVFSQIEKWCAREIIPLSMTREILHPDLQLRIGDFVAPCMQTKLVWMRRDLYRIWNVPYNDLWTETLRSLLSQVHCRMIEKETFFEREGMNPAVFFSQCSLWAEKFVSNGISRSNKQELRKLSFSNKETLDPAVEAIAKFLQRLDKALTDIESWREKIRDQAIQKQSTEASEIGLENSKNDFQKLIKDLDLKTNQTLSGLRAIERNLPKQHTKVPAP